MDLIKKINSHSLNSVKEVCAELETDDFALRRFTGILFGDDAELTRKASWPFYHFAQVHPEKCRKYVGKMLTLLETSGLHNAVYRNITGAFQHVDVPEKYAGRLIDVCVNLVAQPKTLPAITANYITILHKYCNEYPDLKPEIEILLEGLDMSKPSIRSRVNTLFRKP